MQNEKRIRLITLNTHSLLEKDTAFCLKTLADAMLQENADLVCLQEVNQPVGAEALPQEKLAACGYVPADSSQPVREGNFAVQLAEQLRAVQTGWQWTWSYAHCGYGRFDEGVAIFSRMPIDRTIAAWLSPENALCARRLLGVQAADRAFYSVHLGWWKDTEDPLAEQMDRIFAKCAEFAGQSFLLGDFNSPAHLQDEGYAYMLRHEWMDCYPAAQEKDDGITVGGCIDGWREKKVDPMRIDFCFAKPAVTVYSSRVIFNGSFYPVISDHSGILTELE